MDNEKSQFLHMEIRMNSISSGSLYFELFYVQKYKHIFLTLPFLLFFYLLPSFMTDWFHVCFSGVQNNWFSSVFT